MFLGDEGFFRAALDHDPSLLEAGRSSVVRVVPASPTTLDRAAAHGLVRLAAGDGRRERPQHRPARPRALRPSRRVLEALREGRTLARHGRRRLQRGRRLVRDARARDSPEVPRARRRERRAARGDADRTAGPAVRRRRADRTASRSSSCRRAPSTLPETARLRCRGTNDRAHTFNRATLSRRNR